MTFIVMFFFICPMVSGGAYNNPHTNKALFIMIFNAAWFMESLWVQALSLHMIRTRKIPFIQSNASIRVFLFTIISLGLSLGIDYSFFGNMLKLAKLPMIVFIAVLIMVCIYMVSVNIVKKFYIIRYKKFL